MDSENMCVDIEDGVGMEVINFDLGEMDLKYSALREIYLGAKYSLVISDFARNNIEESHKIVLEKIEEGTRIYGVNTGFGKLVTKDIDKSDLPELQRRLILSHSTAVGDICTTKVINLFNVLKLHSLSKGFCGISYQTVSKLVHLINLGWLPQIPEKGSVGACGDLAPMAQWAATWLGYGQVSIKNKIMSSEEGLKICSVEKLSLEPKDGLSIINGTQYSQALALSSLFKLEQSFSNYLLACALSIEAVSNNISFLDSHVQNMHPHKTQVEVAAKLRSLVNYDHREINSADEQDPYSIRCIPQVVGACLNNIKNAKEQILQEANSVTDNPIVDMKNRRLLSGGNFHGQYIAYAADSIAVAIAELGSISERRIACMVGGDVPELEKFLIKNAGLNSGFMIMHVTARALVSENKHLANPLSTDSIPTSANQEDHVSMSTNAVLRLERMIDNLNIIIAIESLCAVQALSLRGKTVQNISLEKFNRKLIDNIGFFEEDRYMGGIIEKVCELIETEELLGELF